ncbi:MAG: alpha/beta hydrolase-fold protein [Bacteroidales bacterium]
MKKYCISFLLFLLLAGNTIVFGQLQTMESLAMKSKILKLEVLFSICLPENYYIDNQRFPVVYLLHGLGDDETSWLEYGRIEQISSQLTGENQIVPMIYVMPQGFRCYYSNSYDSNFMYRDMFVNEFVPYIDSMFRTRAERSQRAMIGYSMGGFGAMMLALKNPEMFGISVPLSMSVRTDDQYKTEEASGWDQQWGKIFGGIGKSGNDRITDFYKQNSPFYVLPEYSNQKVPLIYMVNGDKEETLAKSNEELNILMCKLQIEHEYRINEGGHSFKFWNANMPNALRFVSDAFEGKKYRGDFVQYIEPMPFNEDQMKEVSVNGNTITVFLPVYYHQSSRNYPVIYFVGEFDEEVSDYDICKVTNVLIKQNVIPEMILVFLRPGDLDDLRKTIKETENQFRIRKGFRFKALLTYDGQNLLSEVDKDEFRMLVLSEARISTKQIQQLEKDNFERTSIYLDATQSCWNAEGYGRLHIKLKEKEIKHEYRVRRVNSDYNWFLTGLPEILKYTAESFHK